MVNPVNPLPEIATRLFAALLEREREQPDLFAAAIVVHCQYRISVDDWLIIARAGDFQVMLGVDRQMLDAWGQRNFSATTVEVVLRDILHQRVRAHLALPPDREAVAEARDRAAYEGTLFRQPRDHRVGGQPAQVGADDPNERAHKLLANSLTREQLEEYAIHGYFSVTGSEGGKYQIRKGKTYNIDHLDEHGVFERICVVPKGAPAFGDIMLAQKVSLENDEKATLKVANHQAVRAVSEPPRAAHQPAAAFQAEQWGALFRQQAQAAAYQYEAAQQQAQQRARYAQLASMTQFTAAVQPNALQATQVARPAAPDWLMQRIRGWFD